MARGPLTICAKSETSPLFPDNGAHRSPANSLTVKGGFHRGVIRRELTYGTTRSALRRARARGKRRGAIFVSTKRMCRSLLAVAILVTTMLGTYATRSLAEESAAAELTEAIAADTTGTDAYLSVTSVAGFASEGGEALIETGTANEELFQYASVDPESSRLVGLVRPAPVDHPVGALVEADPDESASTAEPSPSAESGSADEVAESSSPSTGDAAESSAAGLSSFDTNIVDEVVDKVVGAVDDPCANVDCAGLVEDPCSRIDCGIDVSDPCDPNHMGQTCMQYVTATLAEILDNDRCDPYNTGQTCEQYVIGTLASMIQTPDLFCSDYGKQFTLDPTSSGCVAFMLALDPNSPPQDCSSSIEMGLICGAYGALLIGGEDFGGNLVGSVPAQPTEVAGIALPPPASGPGSNLECWEAWHRFFYRNPGGQIIGYGKVTVTWCGNDGTNRIRYFDPGYDAWVRGDWAAVLSISKTSSGVVCNEYDAGSGYCKQRTAWSGWDVYKGWCPYCQRRTPTMQLTGWWQGAHKGAAQGY